MPVLYRKYRPQTFAEVIGQDHVTRTLKNAITSGTIAHAYLFTGTRGVGKTTVARLLAKAVNCEHPEKGEPDGTCPACISINEGRFLDIVEIDAASNTGVENVRELIDQVRFTPTRGKYKVFIIDEVHMLSKSAFNALLKTLEEPPKHALFILATTEVHKVPATIISRTQRFDFRRLSPEQLLIGLEWVIKQEKVKLDNSIVELVASHAEGSLRDALSILDKVFTLGSSPTLADVQNLLGVTDTATNNELLGLISSGKVTELPNFFERLSENGTDFIVANREFLEYLRVLLVAKVSDKKNVTLEAQNLSPSDLMFIIRLFLRSIKDAAISPTPELPMLLASIEAGLKHRQVSPQSSAQEAPASSAASPVENKPGFDSASISEVSEFWPNVIEKLKGINGPLATLVKNSPLSEVAEGKVVLGVRYLFHKEHLESRKNHTLITGLIEEVSGKHLGLQIKLVKDAVPVNATLDAISDALKVFGGELVE